MALTAVGLRSPSMAFASSAQSVSQARPIASPTSTFPWKGDDSPCKVRLPIPGYVSYGRFTTCPPKRVLVLGDSVGVSIGIQMSLGQEDWGTLVDDAGLLRCGFVTGYEIKFEGDRTLLNPHCNNETAIWTSDVRSFEPQAIVVDMGWWDSFRHIINGKVSSLTQPHYDSLVEQRILALIDTLRAVSPAPSYFLSVPWMQPPACRTVSQNPQRQRLLTTRSTVSYSRPHSPRPRHISSISRRT